MTSWLRRSVVVLAAATAVLPGCQWEVPEGPAVDSGLDAPDTDAGVDAPTDAPLDPAMLTTTQQPYAFGPIVIGRVSPVLQITIRNSGEQRSSAITLSLTGASPGEFAVVPTGDTSDCAGATLDPDQTCTAQIRYAPTVDGTPAATLEVSAVTGGTVSVAASGEAVTPANLSTTQLPIDFGDVVTGQQTAVTAVVVRNAGEETTGNISVTLSGAHATEFAIVPTGTATDCAGATLTFQQTCVAQVRFRPTVPMVRTADLTVAATPGNSVTVALTGDGLSPGNLVVELPVSGLLDFGSREVATGATSATQTIRIRNTGGSPTGTLAVTIAGGNGSYSTPTDGCNSTLVANGTCDVTVRFNPSVVGLLPATVTVRDTVAMTGASVNATGIGSARVQVTKTGTGTIVSTPAGISCGSGCSTQTGTFTQTPISVDATADPGWAFTGWTGACASANPSSSCSLPLTLGLTSVGATFTQLFTLNVATVPSGSGGTVTSTSPGILCGNGNTDCTEPYLVNTPVELNAEPDTGWEVYAWSGTGTSCGAGARTCTATMNQTRTVTVEFRRQYTVVANVSGSGSGTVTGSFTGGGSLNCATGNVGTCLATVFDGTTATVTRTIGSAGVDSQIVFNGWGDDCLSAGTAATCNVSINGNKTVSGGFTLQHRVTVTINGTGTGTVMGTGALSCTASCNRYYDAGTNVTLTAAPTGTSLFTAFTGDCSTATCSLPAVSAPRTVVATFNQGYLLTVNATGPGLVTSSPVGISCTAMTGCGYVFPASQLVRLTAAPSGGAGVYTWTGAGAGCGQAATCDVTMDAAKTVGVEFRNLYTLTTSRADGGDGSAAYGTITSTNVSGISCGADCTETYFSGQSVTLDATVSPTAAATLAGSPWTLPGGFSCATNPCTISMTQSLTATANYVIRQYDLTATKAGNAAALGTILRTPAGTACGTDCTRYAYDTDVTITASGTTGVSFTSWSGNCAGNQPCPLDMLANRSAIATFTYDQYTVSAAAGGVGSGSVTGTVAGNPVITCGGDCGELVNHGTVVTLTATPVSGDLFYQWTTGPCTGSTNPMCVVTATAASLSTAVFDNCARSTQSCTSNLFTQCDASGDFVAYDVPNGSATGDPMTIAMNGYTCPLGCHSTLPRCGDIDASNGLNVALDQPATSPSGVDLPSDIAIPARTIKAINTSNFDSVNGLTVVTLDNDAPYSVPAELIVQSGAPEILVLKVRSFKVAAGTTITVSGTRALAIVSHFDIYVAGTIDISGAAGGPGLLTTAGCVGTYASLASGGGAYLGSGGSSSTGGAGGSSVQSSVLTPLSGGCGGGTGGLVPGGRAAGAIQLVSRTQAVFASTALINASGGGGYATCNSANCTSYRATGGGSGGGSSIEAPLIGFVTGSVVAGRGGNGAASNSGTSGGQGTPGTTTGSSNGPGVTCSGCGVGGVGGTESTISGSAGTGTAPAIAGGGGGVGRCVTRNRTGTLTPPSGTMKINFLPQTLPPAR